MISEPSHHSACSQHMISQVVTQTFPPRIRQTFPSGSVREPASASPRIQQEQRLPPAKLCRWPSQQSRPSTAVLVPEKPPLGWQKGHRDSSSTLIPHIRHTHSQHGAKHFWECFFAVPFPALQRRPHASGFAPGCFRCVWSQDPVPPSSATTTAGFLPCLSPPAQKNPQVPQLAGLCKTSGWPLQKPQFQGGDVG